MPGYSPARSTAGSAAVSNPRPNCQCVVASASIVNEPVTDSEMLEAMLPARMRGRAVTTTPPARNSNNQVDEADEEEGDDEVWRLENDEDEAGGRFVRGPEEIRFTNLQLQTKFKHAKDFGITKNYSKAALAEWKLILLDHLNAGATVRYENVNFR